MGWGPTQHFYWPPIVDNNFIDPELWTKILLTPNCGQQFLLTPNCGQNFYWPPIVDSAHIHLNCFFNVFIYFRSLPRSFSGFAIDLDCTLKSQALCALDSGFSRFWPSLNCIGGQHRWKLSPLAAFNMVIFMICLVCDSSLSNSFVLKYVIVNEYATWCL